MCIRDSHEIKSGSICLNFFADLDNINKIWVLPIARICYDPVSYTHLRAHETVLDLVCRLLLEKKQPEHTKSN